MGKIIDFLFGWMIKNGIAQKLWAKYDASTKDHMGKESSGRIQSYTVMLLIVIMVIFTMGIEIKTALNAFSTDKEYEISWNFITFFGMVLGHHLFLLGIKKNAESTPFPGLDSMKKEQPPKEEGNKEEMLLG